MNPYRQIRKKKRKGGQWGTKEMENNNIREVDKKIP